jgi:hypothetical protein
MKTTAAQIFSPRYSSGSGTAAAGQIDGVCGVAESRAN